MEWKKNVLENLWFLMDYITDELIEKEWALEWFKKGCSSTILNMNAPSISIGKMEEMFEIEWKRNRHS